jgi:hypothetical protein
MTVATLFFFKAAHPEDKAAKLRYDVILKNILNKIIFIM